MDKNDYFLQQELLDEVPRFWLSRRWRLAVLGCFGFLIITSNRVGVEVALLCMLNRTSTNVYTTHPLTARFPDHIGIVNPVWRIYSSLSVQQLGLSIASGSHTIGTSSAAEAFTEEPDAEQQLSSYKTAIEPRSDVDGKVRFKRNQLPAESAKRSARLSTQSPKTSVHGADQIRPKLSGIVELLLLNSTNTTIAPVSRKPFVSPSKTEARRPSMTTLKRKPDPKTVTTSSTLDSRMTVSSTSYLQDVSGSFLDEAEINLTFLNFSTFSRDRDNLTLLDLNFTRNGTQVVTGSLQSTKCEFWNATTYSFLDTDLLSVPENGDLNWTREEHTAIWEAYYLGDLIVRIPSAFLAQRFGGKRIFALVVFVESICTALVPLASKLHYFPVLLLRLFTGMSAGFSTPAMYYMLGRWAPADERCLLLAIINTGSWISGCAVVLPLSCLLCTYGFEGGWSSVFYIFGGSGMVWCILWMLFTADTPEMDATIPNDERGYIITSIRASEIMDSKLDGLRCSHTAWLAPLSAPVAAYVDHDNHPHIINNNNSHDSRPTKTTDHLKWPVVLTSVQVLLLTCSEFTHEWIIMTYFSVLPTYNNIILNFAIDEYSVAFIMPCAGFWFAMLMTAGAADRLHSYGVLPVTHVRKVMNCVGCVVSSCMLLSVMFIGCQQRRGLLYISILGLSFAGIQYSGALMAPLDLSSRYSAILIGISGIARASVRFVIPPFAALLLRHNQETGHVDDFKGYEILSRRQSNSTNVLGVYNKTQWYLLFVVTACCHLVVALLYLLVGSAQHQAHWVEKTTEIASHTADHMTSDSAAETTDQEKKNPAKVINSRQTVPHQSSSKNERSLIQISAQSSSRVPPNADDEADGGYVCESASQMVSPAKEDLASENSFISTNTSFEESAADVNQRPTNSRRDEILGNPPGNRSFMDHHSSATMATVESTSANFSLCSSPLDNKFARDFSNDRASFTMESSSDDRTHGNDDGDDDDGDDDDYDDDGEEESGSSVRQLSRHLRSSLAVESDLSESVV